MASGERAGDDGGQELAGGYMSADAQLMASGEGGDMDVGQISPGGQMSTQSHSRQINLKTIYESVLIFLLKWCEGVEAIGEGGNEDFVSTSTHENQKEITLQERVDGKKVDGANGENGSDATKGKDVEEEAEGGLGHQQQGGEGRVSVHRQDTGAGGKGGSSQVEHTCYIDRSSDDGMQVDQYPFHNANPQYLATLSNVATLIEIQLNNSRAADAEIIATQNTTIREHEGTCFHVFV